MDSSESSVYGEQEQSAYNGYFESVCYHPLFLFNSQGDRMGAKLRAGNVHSAKGCEELLLPEKDGPAGVCFWAKGQVKSEIPVKL